MNYVNSVHDTLQGSWNIVKKTQDDDIVQSLQVTAADVTDGHILSTYYDDINFVSTDHFTATTKTLFTTYITHYRK